MHHDIHTQVCSPSIKSRLEDQAHAWVRVLREVAARRAVHLGSPGLAVIVAYRDARGSLTVQSQVVSSSSDEPAALIVGAHPACDVGGVLGASLRHVAIWMDPAIAPGWVHAVDLNTPEGLLVDGEAGIRRVDARCSVRIGAGSADLIVIALAPGENIDLDLLPSVPAPFIPRVRVHVPSAPSPASDSDALERRVPRRAGATEAKKNRMRPKRSQSSSMLPSTEDRWPTTARTRLKTTGSSISPGRSHRR